MEADGVTILGMGNPLLDISAPVKQEFIDKYKIKMGNAILAEKEHLPMYQELSKMEKCEFIAGGATLNTIRVVQWATNQKGYTGYVGCIGKDDFGEVLEKNSSGDGIETRFLIDKETPTGTCAVCIQEKERSLIANLSAANKYKTEHYDSSVVDMAKKAKIIYSSGFFVTVSPETMMKAAKLTMETGGLYCLNLAAPFIVEFFGDKFKEILAYTDILFGNIDEAKHFAKVNKLEDSSARGIAEYLANFKFEKGDRQRIVVITAGSEKTVMARSDGLYLEVPVDKLDKDKIVDLNSAGDAFVGGYLSTLSQGGDYLKCILNGHKCSRYIIQQSGCTLKAKYETL